MYMDYSYDNDWIMSGEAVAVELGGIATGWALSKRHTKGMSKSEALFSHWRSKPLMSNMNTLHEAMRLKKKHEASLFHAKRLGSAAKGLSLFSLASIGFSLADSAMSGVSGLQTRKPGSVPLRPYAEQEFFDSRAAFTQRQRALMVIHNSQLSNRAAFGNEASFMHM